MTYKNASMAKCDADRSTPEPLTAVESVTKLGRDSRLLMQGAI